LPITAVAAAAAALSMAGFPPFLGFIGKELKYEGALAIASEPLLVATAAVVANAFMVAVAGIIALRPFYGSQRQTPKTPHEVPPRMWIGPLLLALLGLTFGLAPSVIADTLVQPAVTAILGRPETVELALWHGFNIPLLLSLLTFGLGVLLYAFHAQLRSLINLWDSRWPISADTAWDCALDGLRWVAAVQTRILQSGRLRQYVSVLFATTALAIGGTFAWTGAARFPEIPPPAHVKEWAAVLLVAAGALLVVVTNSRLTAVCALSIVGVGIALLFVMYGAPDVAITQLLVETLVVVLVAVIMLRMPKLKHDAIAAGRWLDGVLAIAVGTVVTMTLFAVTADPLDRSVTAYFEEASVPDAYGRNIVNVILVDFRALDTFGEIAVVVVAAIGAYALIRGWAGRNRA
jgi:multicomponent Na+:H+ antiporter subunit A